MKILITTERELRDFVIPFHQTITLGTPLLNSTGKLVGAWTTPSIFLGNTTKGNYSLEISPGYPERNIPNEAKFPPKGVPVAYFYDNLSTPFMALFDFSPLKVISKGFGRIVRSPTTIYRRYTIEWLNVT